MSKLQEIKELCRTGTEDVQNCFGIKENLFEKYIENEVEKNDLLVPLIERRQNNFDWKIETKLGGPGTTLNAYILYALIRHFDMGNVLETGVAGGFYTTFMLAALKKNYPGRLISLELSDDEKEVGKLIPKELRTPLDGASGWDLRMGASSLEYFKTLKFLRTTHHAGLYSHDSLHTFSHMTKELLEFKQSSSKHFIVFFDDQMSDDFWNRSLKMKLFEKKGFEVKWISGSESRLRGHIGGFIQYKRL